MSRFRPLPALLASLLLLSPAGHAAVPESPLGPCPPEARALLDTFYRWHVASQQAERAVSFASQQARFTPRLYADLRRAFALTPDDGAFVDFDPFSGTQVGTFGHRVVGCRRQGGTGLSARVAVVVGRSTRSAVREEVPLAFSLERSGAGWRIADIRYLKGADFTLQSFLTELLQRVRR